VSLRDLQGHDELLPDGTGPVAASALLGRLGVPAPGELTLAERDRLIAELHRAMFGDAVDAQAHCSRCGGGFALAFSLDSLLASLDARAAGAEIGLSGPDSAGVYALPGGCRFRLPTTDDERALAALEQADDLARALLERCVLEGDPVEHGGAVERAMEALAPAIDLELPARCAMCGDAQRVPFEMVAFFFGTLLRERPLLHREVHCLAARYHWSHHEILGLPRAERRAYVALILASHRAADRDEWTVDQ
jgi:hypothetical protein